MGGGISKELGPKTNSHESSINSPLFEYAATSDWEKLQEAITESDIIFGTGTIDGSHDHKSKDSKSLLEQILTVAQLEFVVNEDGNPELDEEGALIETEKSGTVKTLIKDMIENELSIFKPNFAMNNKLDQLFDGDPERAERLCSKNTSTYNKYYSQEHDITHSLSIQSQRNSQGFTRS